MEPELSFDTLPPYRVSVDTGKPATLPIPTFDGALPSKIMAPQSPGVFTVAAEVNTTGLFNVPLMYSLDPCVITNTLLFAAALFTWAYTVMPAGMVSVALFLTYTCPLRK